MGATYSTDAWNLRRSSANRGTWFPHFQPAFESHADENATGVEQRLAGASPLSTWSPHPRSNRSRNTFFPIASEVVHSAPREIGHLLLFSFERHGDGPLDSKDPRRTKGSGNNRRDSMSNSVTVTPGGPLDPRFSPGEHPGGPGGPPRPRPPYPALSVIKVCQPGRTAEPRVDARPNLLSAKLR
jgi:hypothetical protein